MSIIHALVGFAEGGLTGVQVAQRDWSPYVVHFTSWAAMSRVREVLTVSKCESPAKVKDLLSEADTESYKVFSKICAEKRLVAKSLSEEDNLPDCVCLTECNLAGLISHAERFGRFGLVFKKSAILKAGGAPCYYLPPADYASLSQAFKTSSDESHRRIWGLANVLRPPGGCRPIQDYSHEREWRIFRDIDLTSTCVHFLLAPESYCHQISLILPQTLILPIDTLYSIGA